MKRYFRISGSQWIRYMKPIKHQIRKQKRVSVVILKVDEVSNTRTGPSCGCPWRSSYCVKVQQIKHTLVINCSRTSGSHNSTLASSCNTGICFNFSKCILEKESKAVLHSALHLQLQVPRPHTTDHHLFIAEQQTAAWRGILNGDRQTEIRSPLI